MLGKLAIAPFKLQIFLYSLFLSLSTPGEFTLCWGIKTFKKRRRRKQRCNKSHITLLRSGQNDRSAKGLKGSGEKGEKNFNFKSIIIFINHSPAINLSLCLSERSIIRSI